MTMLLSCRIKDFDSPGDIDLKITKPKNMSALSNVNFKFDLEIKSCGALW